MNAKKKNNKKDSNLYVNSLISKKIVVPFQYLGDNNIKPTIEKILANEVEGKCVVEGYIEPKSVSIKTYSSGMLNGNNINFDVIYECNICSPVENMHIDCIAKNITQAGIRAEIDINPSPLIIYLSRDHHYSSNNFNNVKENDKINVRVIGSRFELNDKYISVIGELLEEKFTNKKKGGKVKLNIIE